MNAKKNTENDKDFGVQRRGALVPDVGEGHDVWILQHLHVSHVI